jgi:hypothetical protein
MPVIPVNRVVDRKIIIGKNGGSRGGRHKGYCPKKGEQMGLSWIQRQRPSPNLSIFWKPI